MRRKFARHLFIRSTLEADLRVLVTLEVRDHRLHLAHHRLQQHRSGQVLAPSVTSLTIGDENVWSDNAKYLFITLVPCNSNPGNSYGDDYSVSPECIADLDEQKQFLSRYPSLITLYNNERFVPQEYGEDAIVKESKINKILFNQD